MNIQTVKDAVLCQCDCLDVSADMDPNSVDTIITDPPYGLEFMGKGWDHGVPGIPYWKAALRVAKPGAMLLAFGGTRTFHRLACAIEDAGWEIRDCMMWLYGSGFPKSLDISKAIDKAAGVKREVVGINPNHRYGGGGISETHRGGWSAAGHQIHTGEGNITTPTTEAAQMWDGWGTALKPAWEPIIVAMKPCEGPFASNALQWGVAGMWIDGSRIETKAESFIDKGRTPTGVSLGWAKTEHGEVVYDGSKGRWPANVVLDEEAAAMLDEQTSGGASRFFYCSKASRRERNIGLEDFYWQRDTSPIGFVRTTKEIWETISLKDRAEGNIHPTVKPLSLMRYLCKLASTPAGGLVYDPFMGCNSTGIAALLEGRMFVGAEIYKDYFDIACTHTEAMT